MGCCFPLQTMRRCWEGRETAREGKERSLGDILLLRENKEKLTNKQLNTTCRAHYRSMDSCHPFARFFHCGRIETEQKGQVCLFGKFEICWCEGQLTQLFHFYEVLMVFLLSAGIFVIFLF